MKEGPHPRNVFTGRSYLMCVVSLYKSNNQSLGNTKRYDYVDDNCVTSVVKVGKCEIWMHRNIRANVAFYLCTGLALR
jgi:hypothetical protein